MFIKEFLDAGEDLEKRVKDLSLIDFEYALDRLKSYTTLIPQSEHTSLKYLEAHDIYMDLQRRLANLSEDEYSAAV